MSTISLLELFSRFILWSSSQYQLFSIISSFLCFITHSLDRSLSFRLREKISTIQDAPSFQMMTHSKLFLWATYVILKIEHSGYLFRRKAKIRLSRTYNKITSRTKDRIEVPEGFDSPLNPGYIAGPTYILEYMVQMEYGFLSNKPWYTKLLPFGNNIYFIDFGI